MTDVANTISILSALRDLPNLTADERAFIDEKKDALAPLADGFAAAWENVKDKTSPTEDELKAVYDVMRTNSPRPIAAFSDLIKGLSGGVDLSGVSAGKLYEWGNELSRLSPRAPGTQAMDSASDYITDKLRSFGVQTYVEPLNFKGVFFHEWLFETESPFKKAFTAFPQNNAAFGDVRAELVYVGSGNPEDYGGKNVKGKLLLINLNGIMRHEGPCILRKRYGLLAIYDTAYLNGAAGIIGFFTDTPGNTLRLLEPGIKPMGGSNVSGPSEIGSDHEFALPVLNIGAQDAQILINTLENEKKQIFARLKIKGTRKVSTTPINIGFLPGKSEKIIAVASHSCTAFEGALCDTAGVVGTLAIAEYFGALPAEKREKSMLFFFDSFHVWGNCCQAALTVLDRYPEYAANTEAFLWLDHLTDGQPLTPRVINASDNPVLWPLTAMAAAASGVSPIALPIARIWSVCATGAFERSGVATMTVQAINDYVLTPEDTWDKFREDVVRRDICFHIRLASALHRIYVAPDPASEPIGGCGSLFTETEEPEYPKGQSYVPEKSYPLYKGGADSPIRVESF